MGQGAGQGRKESLPSSEALEGFIRRKHKGAAMYNPTTQTLQLTMSGDDININHCTTQLLEHLDH